MGKRKIEIKKISDKKTLKVTCSKRRKGLFRKADDFCSKTGAHIAIITFSPGDKPFTFGHPSVESIIDRYELCAQNSNDNEILDEDLDLEASQERREEVGLSEKENESLEREEVYMSDDEKELLEGMGLNDLKQYARWVEDERNKLIWKIENRKRGDSCTVDWLGMIKGSTTVDLKRFGTNMREEMDLEEMKRRESCTKDFLSML